MTKREYAEKVAEIIGGKVITTEKANGIVLTGVMREQEGSNMSPIVYIDEYYKDGFPVEEVAKRAEEIIKKNSRGNFDVEILSKWENVRPLLRARLYNDKTKAEVKRSAKSYGFSDLIIVPYIDLNDYMEGSSVKITKALVEQYGVTERTVIDTAIKNSAKDISVVSMREMMKQMMKIDDEMFEAMFPETEPLMYVISNSRKFFGAIGAISAKKLLSEMFPEGYAIIPSSVHEIIAVPLKEDVSEDELSNMITEVNATNVAAEEVLGSHAYIFREVA